MKKRIAQRIFVTVCGLCLASGIAFPKGELAQSIIVVLDEDSRDYQDAVFNRLTPKVEALRATLSETLSNVRGAWQIHQNQPSLDTSLAYEEAVSEGLHSINTCFEATALFQDNGFDPSTLHNEPSNSGTEALPNDQTTHQLATTENGGAQKR